MDPKNDNDLVFQYLKEDLSPGEKQNLERMLREKGYDPDELQEMRELYLQIDDLPVPEPGEGMTDGFYAMLVTSDAGAGPNGHGVIRFYP